MPHIIDFTTRQLKQSLLHDGQWHPDSFKIIVVEMFKCRPSLYVYHNNFYSRDNQYNMDTYANLLDLACEYVDTLGYPWMKAELKHIVWFDFKGFYDTLAQLVSDGRKNLPFGEIEISLMVALAAIWVKVGTFSELPTTIDETTEKLVTTIYN